MSTQAKTHAYTILEITIVILVLGGLAAIATPAFMNQVKKIRNQEAHITLLALYSAQKDYQRETGGYTDDIGDLDIEMRASEYFKTPVAENSATISCGGGSSSYLASVQTKDNAYTLYALESDARIVCTPCPGTVCSKMGYQSF